MAMTAWSAKVFRSSTCVSENAATLRCASEIAPIFLLSPTTSDARIAAIASLARGYVYYVSLKGVTGAGHLDTADVARRLADIRRHVRLPVGVGFGIRDAASAQAIAAHADAIVIGSRIIEEIEQAPPGEAAARAGRWLSGIRAALDAKPKVGSETPFALRPENG